MKARGAGTRHKEGRDRVKRSILTCAGEDPSGGGGGGPGGGGWQGGWGQAYLLAQRRESWG